MQENLDVKINLVFVGKDALVVQDEVTIPANLSKDNFYGVWRLKDKPKLLEFSQDVVFTSPKAVVIDPIDSVNTWNGMQCHLSSVGEGNLQLVYMSETGSTVVYNDYENWGNVSSSKQVITFPKPGQTVSETFYKWMLENATYQPAEYSYNGTVLPKLPEWDKTAYPYAVITSLNDSSHSLVCFSAPVYYHDGYLSNYFRSKDVCSSIGFYYEEPSHYEWTSTTNYEKTDIAAGENIVMALTPIWANFEVLNEDNTVKLTASDPVPVYE